MKLLIITQVMDTKHPILGFFHRWVEEFSKHCDQVQVICLEEGDHHLPENVFVHSLGKEECKGRLTYVWRFYKLIWKLRKQYDGVFVHMNQIYVILGAPFWRIIGKKIGLWYAHGSVTSSLKWAEKFTHKVFTASKESFVLPSEKVMVTGHGIDGEQFAPQTALHKDLDLITVGRITESKNLITLIECLAEVRKKHDVSLSVVGAATSDAEHEYKQLLEKRIQELQLEQAVKFMGPIYQAELPACLNRAKLFVTTAQNGSLDKAMLEAMACGLPIVSMAPGSASLPLGANQTSTKEEFVTAVSHVLESEDYSSQKNVQHIKESHSLTKLIPKILSQY